MKKKKLYFLTILFFACLSAAVFAEDAVDWIGSYSSGEMEGQDQNGQPKEGNVYYYWQLESLKRAVSPRYIRFVDIENYPNRNKLLTRGILFTYNGLMVDETGVCGNFTSWRCVPMKKNKFGIFYTVILPELKNRNKEDNPHYEYKFQVDGLFEFDPENQNKKEDGEGSYISEYILEQKDIEKQISAMVLENVPGEEFDFRTVDFKIYLPDAETVTLVGDFNNLNPEHDYMKKDRNGIFTVRKKLKTGEYLYNYIVDGKTMLDTYNPESRQKGNTEEISSFIDVPDRAAPMEKL
ncbi:MAG: carbohydrate-binding module 48 [Leptospira sp.]|nr:carbohydrate-binding module 48 [Leptospira sp.]